MCLIDSLSTFSKFKHFYTFCMSAFYVLYVNVLIQEDLITVTKDLLNRKILLIPYLTLIKKRAFICYNYRNIRVFFPNNFLRFSEQHAF